MRKFKVHRPKRLPGLSPRAWTLIEMLAVFLALAAGIGLVAMTVM